VPCSFIAAKKRKQQVETSETMGGISINPACTPEQAGKKSTF
jgi:hypothetical protein